MMLALLASSRGPGDLAGGCRSELMPQQLVVARLVAKPSEGRNLKTLAFPGRAGIRTAHKYSNAIDRQRLRKAVARQQPAPTTSYDLAAESSHRGDHDTMNGFAES